MNTEEQQTPRGKAGFTESQDASYPGKVLNSIMLTLMQKSQTNTKEVNKTFWEMQDGWRAAEASKK